MPATPPHQAIRFALALLLATSAACRQHEESRPAFPSAGAARQSDSSQTPKTTLFDAQPVPTGSHTLRFINRAAEAGIRFAYNNGRESEVDSIVETLGGGVGMLDYDGNGSLDLFFPGGGRFRGDRQPVGAAPLLLRNHGDWQFEEVTGWAGLATTELFTHGCAAGDFDNDGFTDLLVTGYGGMRLYRNQGDGTFQEVHVAAGLTDDPWCTSAAWGDVNGNGLLDLYVVRYVDWSPENHKHCPGPSPDLQEICGPKHYEPVSDTLYLNHGDGTFRDGTRAAQLRPGGKGLGVVIGDVDLDGDVDIYVVNDTTDNFLYLNDGQGVFQERGLVTGVAVDDQGMANGSMGVDLADFNGNGLPDLWATNYEHETFALYRNDGDRQFLHVSRMSGIAAVGDLFVGWGTGFADFNRDGKLDVVAATGHVMKYPRTAPVKQLPLLFLNQRPRFVRAQLPPNDYFSLPHDGRGLALGDLNNNGHMDLAISHNNAPIAILSNETPTDGHWLRVRLVGVASNRDAVGANVMLHTSDGDQLRQVKGGGSYLSQHDLALCWGIPTEVEVEGLTIHWPSGLVQKLAAITPNRRWTLIEPAAVTR